MEFYLILGNTKAMVFTWEGGGFTTKRKRGKNTVHKWLKLPPVVVHIYQIILLLR